MTIRGDPPGKAAPAGATDDLADLIGRVAARDAAAFAALYKQTSAKLYGVIARILPRGDLGAEALQEAYVRIWEKAGDFDPLRGSPLAWMATIARNRALDEVRRVRPGSLEDLPESFEPAADEVDPLAARERSEALAALVNCLQALDEEKRAVVLLAYYRGWSSRGARQALRAARADDQDLAASQPCATEGLSGVMTVTPDDDFAAAEYALGTLDPAERATLAARRLREPELDQAIRAWEARLAPLAEATPAIEPPRRPSGRDRGTDSRRFRCAQPPAADSTVVVLRRSVTRWRTAAIAASVIAGLLAIGLIARETTREALPRQYVAILQKDAASPAFEVTVNLDRQELTVRPVAAQTPPGKAYELWIIDPRLGAPRSLGVIGETTRAANLAAYDRAVVENATYAVTVEPPGGSPSGQPSGPPVFVGKLIPVGP